MSQSYCDTCRYWHPIEPGVGQCRRYAPGPLIRPVGDESEQRPTWPTTGQADTCGEHEEREIPQ